MAAVLPSLFRRWAASILVLLIRWSSCAHSRAAARQADEWATMAVDRPIVELPAGVFRAERLRLKEGLGKTFLRLRGIQYAEHPVGELRWQPPQPLHPREDAKIIDATSFGADCINAPWLARFVAIGLAKMSEECLFLNVWAPEPTNRTNTKLPVMFWIHGGAFVSGGTSSYPGEGIIMTRPDIVLVTANYRLGPLGFLAGAAVARSSRDGSAGNFGLQDTREAMRWVQRNIAHLGGSPSKVTIFGESSGSSFVALHLVSPRSAGLFAAAIMQSGAFDNYTMQASPESNFHRFAKLAKCDGQQDDDHVLACLRSRPIRALFQDSLLPAIAQSQGNFSPVVDDVEFTATPEVLAAKGQINSVKGVILGTTENEGRLLMPVTLPVPGAPLTNESQFHQWLLEQFSPSVAAAVAKRYPASNSYGRASNHSYWTAAAHVFTDSQYKCPTRRSARWLMRSNAVPQTRVYTYQLRYEPALFGLVGDVEYWYEWCRDYAFCHNATKFPIGVGHGADIFLIWNLHHALVTDNDRTLSRTMLNWWQNFATSYDPNEVHMAPTTEWPPYAKGNETMLVKPQLETTMLSENLCDFWDSVHPVPYGSSSVRQHQHTMPIVV